MNVFYASTLCIHCGAERQVGVVENLFGGVLNDAGLTFSNLRLLM